LAPNIDMRRNADLPFASTLCGSCSNVCPVKIDIHDQLWKWRQVLMQEGHGANGKKTMMKGMAWVLSHPSVYRFAGSAGRKLMRWVPWLFNNTIVNPWYKSREMPEPPMQSFREWYQQNKK